MNPAEFLGLQAPEERCFVPLGIVFSPSCCTPLLLRRVRLLLPTPLGRAHLLQVLDELLRCSRPWRRLLCGSGRLFLWWWRWGRPGFGLVIVGTCIRIGLRRR